MNPNTIKAVRATIKLGKFEIETFEFSDGSYGYEYSWLAELIGRDKQILSNKKSPYYLKAIVGEVLTHQSIKIGGISASDNKKKYLTQDQLMNVLGAFGKLQNQACIDLLTSCAIEALERRADAAFGKQRTEVEHNDRTIARIEGKAARRGLTDSIKDYLSGHPELSIDYLKYIYINCSDYLNVVVLGCRSKSAKEFYQLADRDALRDRVPAKALRELETAENLATRLIDDGGYEPLAAVKKACDIAFIKSIGLD